MKKLLICLFLISLGFAPAACNQRQPQPEQDDFQSYWNTFRTESLSMRARKVADMTQFPFITRGEMDEDPEVTGDRKWFERMYPAVLQADPGLKPEPETMMQFIYRTPRITEREHAPGSDFARVGAFEFVKVGGVWKFVRAYWAE